MDPARPHILHAHLPGLVHHGGAPAGGVPAPRPVLVCGQQGLRPHLQLGELLDTRHRDAGDVLAHL